MSSAKTDFRSTLRRIQAKQDELENAIYQYERVSESYAEEGGMELFFDDEPFDVRVCLARVRRLDTQFQQMCEEAGIPNDYRDHVTVQWAR